MLKKFALIASAIALSLSLYACAANEGVEVEDAASSNETEAQEYDPVVDSIDLSLEDGSVRFVRVEKANAELTDSSNALVFVFDFTNEQSSPAQVQSVFRFQFFQNGAELSKNLSYSSEGGEQYELVSSFFDNAMKGGTVTFGKIVEPEDDSSITVMVSPNGSALGDDYQTMEVNIADLDSAGAPKASASVEQVNAALQGTWSVEDSGAFTFDRGVLTVDAGGAVMAGTYEVDATTSTVIGHLETSDGTVKVTLPYQYAGDTMKLYNNRNVEMVKMS